MALDLNAVATKRAVTTVDYMGQKATVKYDPSLLTEEKVTAAQTDEKEFVEFFTACVKDWDVKRGTKKVPVTEKAMREIPLPFLRAVFRAILSDSGAEEDEGKASSAG